MKYKTWWIILSCTLIVGIIIFSCSGPDEPTYGSKHPDPNPSGLATPILDSLSPGEGYLKDIIKVYGSGFNANPKYNFISFGKNIGNILDATPNELTVQTPNISNDTVNVKVSIKGSEYWSKELPFIFKNTLEIIDEEIVWPNGVAIDDSENVYIGSADEGIIYKISPNGNKTEFAYEPISGAMEFGPDNYLYVCEQGEGKIVRISPDGGTVEDVVEVESPIDFDWDSNQDMYIVSNWIEAEEMGGIFSYNSSGTLTQLVTLGSPKCIRIFDQNLFVSNIWDSQILKYEITASGLENEEIIYEGDSPLGIEIDTEGTLYFTEAWETSLYTLAPDGSEEILYEGELMTPMHYLTFYGKKMYIVYPGWGDVGSTMSAYIGVEQAPNYGRP